MAVRHYPVGTAVPTDCSFGSFTTNVEPLEGVLETVISPWRARTTSRATHRPMPNLTLGASLSSFTKRSKMRSWSASAIPTPLSVTVRRMVSASASRRTSMGAWLP